MQWKEINEGELAMKRIAAFIFFSIALIFIFTSVQAEERLTKTQMRQVAEELQYVHHRSTPTRPDDPVTLFEMTDESFTGGLTNKGSRSERWKITMNRGGVAYYPPGGWVEDHAQRKKRFSLKLTGTTVRGVLDALTAADTNYHWLWEDGVFITTYRQPGPNDPDIMKALDQKIVGRLDISENTMWEAVDALLERIRAQGITQFTGPGRPSGPVKEWESDEDQSIKLSLENKTIRQCLDAIVAADTPAHWSAVLDKHDKTKIFIEADSYLGYGRNPKVSKEEQERREKARAEGIQDPRWKPQWAPP